MHSSNALERNQRYVAPESHVPRPQPVKISANVSFPLLSNVNARITPPSSVRSAAAKSHRSRSADPLDHYYQVYLTNPPQRTDLPHIHVNPAAQTNFHPLRQPRAPAMRREPDLRCRPSEPGLQLDRGLPGPLCVLGWSFLWRLRRVAVSRPQSSVH